MILRKVRVHILYGRHMSGSNMMISAFIFEFTGEMRDRKQVMNHIKHIKGFSCRMEGSLPRLSQQMVDAATQLQKCSPYDVPEMTIQNNRIQNAASTLAFRNQHAFRYRSSAPTTSSITFPRATTHQRAKSLFSNLSHFGLKHEDEILITPLPPMPKHFLALATVCSQFRAEATEYLGSRVCLEFLDNIETIQIFCRLVEPEHRQRIRNISIQVIGSLNRHNRSLSPNLSTYLNTNIPDLQILFISYIPREPNHLDLWWLPDRSSQTVESFSGPKRLKARVLMSMRWESDCNQFELERLGTPGWQCIDADNWDGLREIL